MKITIVCAGLLIAWSAFERAEAQTYNGPITPKPSGLSIYSYYGTWDDVTNALDSTASLVGVPEGYKFLAWFGRNTVAQSYAIDWSNGTIGGLGIKYPNIVPGINSYTPLFVWDTDSSSYATSAYNTSTNVPGDNFTTTMSDLRYYAVAVSLSQ